MGLEESLDPFICSSLSVATLNNSLFSAFHYYPYL